MQVVIDIPDTQYEIILRSDENWAASCASKEAMMYAIKTGTPLPKGHGDLKDMENIYEVLEGWDDDTSWIVDAIDCQVPTIIEADKEENPF